LPTVLFLLVLLSLFFQIATVPFFPLNAELLLLLLLFRLTTVLFLLSAKLLLLATVLLLALLTRHAHA
jgi:hypothetical protein